MSSVAAVRRAARRAAEKTTDVWVEKVDDPVEMFEIIFNNFVRQINKLVHQSKGDIGKRHDRLWPIAVKEFAKTFIAKLDDEALKTYICNMVAFYYQPMWFKLAKLY